MCTGMIGAQIHWLCDMSPLCWIPAVFPAVYRYPADWLLACSNFSLLKHHLTEIYSYICIHIYIHTCMHVYTHTYKSREEYFAWRYKQTYDSSFLFHCQYHAVTQTSLGIEVTVGNHHISSIFYKDITSFKQYPTSGITLILFQI